MCGGSAGTNISESSHTELSQVLKPSSGIGEPDYTMLCEFVRHRDDCHEGLGGGGEIQDGRGGVLQQGNVMVRAASSKAEQQSS